MVKYKILWQKYLHVVRKSAVVVTSGLYFFSIRLQLGSFYIGKNKIDRYRLKQIREKICEK